MILNPAHFISWIFVALVLLSAALPARSDSPRPTRRKAPDTEAMADVASPEETHAFLAAQGDPELLVFTEERSRPVRRDDALPRVWLRRTNAERETFAGTAQPGEFYAFQIAVYNATDAAFSVVSATLDLPGVPAEKRHCLNFETRPYDEPPLRDGLPLAPHALKTLWMAVEAPMSTGERKGAVTILCHNTVSGQFQTLTVPIALRISGAPLTDGGVGEAWRLARLKWLLPSDLGNTSEPTKGYDPVRRQGRTLRLTGKAVRLAETGLPAQIESYLSASNTRSGKTARTLLAAPVNFVVETESGAVTLQPEGGVRFTAESREGVSWTARSRGRDFTLETRGRLEFDGYLRYSMRLTAAQAVDVKDVRLEVPYRADTARYLMGLGARGGRRSKVLDWKWDLAKHQDRVWIGDVNIGAQWQFKGANYRRPLVNFYYGFRPLVLPESWGNSGRGGIRVNEDALHTVTLAAYSGARRLRADETVVFDMEVSLTPARPIDTDEQWATRFYHPGDGVDTGTGEKYLANMQAAGANVLNLHHRQRLNPFINYPFNDSSVPELAALVRKAHAQNLRVKIYDTTRELTQNLPEFFALHRLDGAVIQPGPGPRTRTLLHPNGPHPWLNENLRTNFIPAWQTELDGKYAGRKDLSVLTRPDGAWNNFYLAGLNWLTEKADIDGVYVDDTALDRSTLLRARRILEAHRPAPLIDFHSWNPFDHEDSYIVSASLYMDLFPFVDRLWLGEAANYDQGPDAWLVQYAGIPFGVMSEMLQDGGGNPWRGMLFGMTGRFGAAGDPRPLWRFWDRFGMQGTEMIGWWDSADPVKTGRDDVLATVYRKKGRALVALASWAKEPAAVTLQVDWKALGLDPARATLRAEEIPGFQHTATFTPARPIEVLPGRGWLLVLETPGHAR